MAACAANSTIAIDRLVMSQSRGGAIEIFDCFIFEDDQNYSLHFVFTRKMSIGKSKINRKVMDRNGLPVSFDHPLLPSHDEMHRYLFMR